MSDCADNDKSESLDGSPTIFKLMEEFVSNAIRANKKLKAIIEPVKFEYRADQRVIDWLEKLPELSRDAMAVALRRGWFFGWSMSLNELAVLFRRLESASAEDIDLLLSEHHRNYFAHHRDLLLEAYPYRRAAINAACDAHLAGRDGYFLSVPVFLAQADGALTEFLGLKRSALGVDKRGIAANGGSYDKLATTRIQELLKDRPDALSLVYPIVVLKELDLLAPGGGKKDVYDAYLNRHAILHGETSDYGTELISLKAFAFLCHAALHVPSIVENFQETKDL